MTADLEKSVCKQLVIPKVNQSLGMSNFSYSPDLNDKRLRKVSLNPECLMREFTHDENYTTASPSSMFKSSFAKEVVQNVRKSMTSLQVQAVSHHLEVDDDFLPATGPVSMLVFQIGLPAG